MIRFRAPAVRDSAPVVALAPTESPSSSWESDASREPEALEQFFDRAFPVVDCCLRRLLRALEVDFDALGARALRVALQVGLARLTGIGGRTLREQNRSYSKDEDWSLELCAAVGATRVALETLVATSPGFGDPIELAQLRRSLAGMPSRDAEVLILVDLFGHEPRELSVLFGLATWRVRSYLARGRRRLRQWRAAGRVAM